MTKRRSARLALALIGLMGAGFGAAPAWADEAPAASGGTQMETATVSPPAAPEKPAAKPKAAKKRPVKLEKEKQASRAAEQYDAPLQLDFDPMKRVILKAEPSVPYQPQVASRLPPVKTSDDNGQAHLAPLLRESSTPDSFGDKGSFIDRHEFGIQLKDHF